MNATTEITAKGLNEKSGNQPRQSSRKRGDGIYNRILFGVDFSPASAAVFKHALKLAKQNNAELLILHAYDVPGTVSFLPPDCYEDWLKNYRTQTTNETKRLVDQARREGVRCHALIRQGPPEYAIAAAVRKAKIDLAVIGTHGRRGLSRFIMGSTALRIIPRVGCPVLTVRTPPQK
jgi:nucleotide-binding universal stress UspA family protein